MPTTAAAKGGEQQKEESVPAKVWTTLISNMAYLPGLPTLDYSLKAAGSKYPLVALTTDTFPAEGYAALKARGIPWNRIPYLLPSIPKEYTDDPRLYDCWSKLTLRKTHYSKEWIADNCASTTQHHDPQAAQHSGAGPKAGLGMPNGGLQVLVPCQAVYNLILDTSKSVLTVEMDFADQSLLSQCFAGRWVDLPYIYNALKTLRWEGVHNVIWKDDQVKNVHLLLSLKPWEEAEGHRGISDETHKWWWEHNDRRTAEEKIMGVDDGF